MNRSTVSLVSAVLFMVFAVLLAFVPVPYVTINPGKVYDVLGNYNGKPTIQIKNIKSYPAKGHLFLTTVAISRSDSLVNLPQALANYWRSSSEALPREIYYPVGKTPGQIDAEGLEEMDLSRHSAEIAAQLAANKPVLRKPLVVSVPHSSSAYGRILLGDFIVKVDSQGVKTVKEVKDAVQAHGIGESVVFHVIRDGKPVSVSVITESSKDNKKMTSLLFDIKEHYLPGKNITLNIDKNVFGPSGGLIFALGIYSHLVKEDIIKNRRIAGTGVITENGTVKEIGGIQQKILAAKSAKAEIFLLPSANCSEAKKLKVPMELISVTSLKDAVTALKKLGDPAHDAEVKRCG